MKTTEQVQVLYTSEPLPDEIEKLRKGYWVCIVCCLLGSIVPILLPGGLLALLVFWIFMQNHTEHVRLNLRKKKFLFKPNINDDQLFLAIQSVLMKKYGMQLERSKAGNVIVMHDKLIYDILINEDNTFSIWWRMTAARAFFTIDREKKGYRKSRMAMGIIAYEIQTAFGINAPNGIIKEG